AGHWTAADGATPPDLAGCLDVDIRVTPFTNTLPIRRLGLRPGESAELAVAYLALPALAVTRERQRYTCLAAGPDGGLYRYESLPGGFRADLSVDADGLVLDYPGLFRRVWTGEVGRA
ncbi:MAG TPA: putative glycolipid-binding domain-containing protein, partial [Thermomicrobiales bacterium]|nr:putative glycolipid-binding domain-containing protein [Thermomicrobiales bacterium]